MKNILLTGGTGFIGTQLRSILAQKGYKVFVLTRNKTKCLSDSSFIHWQPENNFVSEAIDGISCTIINLAGENIANKRWNKRHKENVLKSRTDVLSTLLMLCSSQRIVCDHLISSSAIGYYGNLMGLQAETSMGDESYLSQTCKLWEEATQPFKALNIEVSIVRIGVVLGKEQGAFPKLLATLPFKFVGIPGNGQQIFSWIHIEDVCGIVTHLLENKIGGIYNAVAPQPVSMKDFFLAVKLQKPYWLGMSIPAFMLKLIMGEMAIEILKSTEVSAAKTQSVGYKYQYATIDKALRNLL